MEAFLKINRFTVEELLEGIYFHFDYLLNKKIFLLNSLTSVTRTIARF